MRNAVPLLMLGIATGAMAQNSVQPYTAPTVKPYTAPSVQPYQASKVRPYQERTAQPDTRSGQKTAFSHGVYLTNEGCQNLHCDAAPGLVGVVDTFNGVAPQYARHWLTLLVVNEQATDRILENRHVGVLSNGAFNSFVAGYNKPAGRYVFMLFPADHIDKAHLIGGGMFTVTKKTQPDPLQPVARTVVGTWDGYDLMSHMGYGTLQLNADGSYDKDGKFAGHYVASNGHLHFDGALAAWNNGNATTNAHGVMVFHWIKQGWAVDIEFSKRK